MRIEQIIEFELKVPKPLVVRVFLKLIIFMTKQKSPRRIFDWIYYLMRKVLKKAMNLTSPDQSQVTKKFNTKMQNFKIVLDLTWSKDFFDRLSNLKILFFKMALKTFKMWSKWH